MKRFIVLCAIIASVFIRPILSNPYLVIDDQDKYKILVVKDIRKIFFFLDNTKSYVFSVAIGKDEAENRTPEGLFKTIGIEQNYLWSPTDEQRKFYKEKRHRILPKKVKHTEPYNPWGSRRLKLNVTRPDGFNIFIHNTNESFAIGKAVTSGCVRVAKNKKTDVLFDCSKKGDFVKIVETFPVPVIKWL